MYTGPEWLTDELLREACAGLPRVPDGDPMDLGQEVVVRILAQPGGLSRFRTARDFVAYVRAAARNLATDYARRAKVYATKVAPVVAVAVRPAAAEHPQERIYDADLQGALVDVSQREREVFTLRSWGY